MREEAGGRCSCARLEGVRSHPGVARCLRCHVLWRRRDRGDWAHLGSDAFPYADLGKLEHALGPYDLLRVPYVELVKYVPLETLSRLRVRLEKERPDLAAR